MAFKGRILGRVFVAALIFAVLWTLYSLYERRGALKALRIKGRQKESLLLTQEQCAAAFPGFSTEVDKAVGRGKFDFEMPSEGYTGLAQVRIKGGHLYILSVSRDVAQNVLGYRTSILHQLHRAILTSPTPLPDTVFSLCINDRPRIGSWSFSRPRDPGGDAYWLMPHFSYWTWPQPFIGSLDSALSKITEIEQMTPWSQKIDKAVWRGTVGFNPLDNQHLRPNLVQTARGREWADVEVLEGLGGGATPANALKIEDFCRYKYILYTEGVTYSGRLPYHQACASVVLTPPLGFFLHTSHLMKPMLASDLLSARTAAAAAEANAVFVAPDWSDLEETVAYLRANPEVASGIASRQRKLMVEGGYLSPGAEMCYWRALIEGWSRVANVTHIEEEGVRWELFTVTGKTE